MTVHVRLKSNGAYWQAFWIDRDGRPHAKSLGAKSKLSRRQANVRCTELSIQISKGKIIAGAPRLSEWIDHYKSIRTDQGKATRYINEATGKYLMLYFDNDPTIDRITRADAADWRRALATGELAIDNANRCTAPVESTVCKHVRVAKRIFREAEDQERIDKNPFSKLKSTAPKVVKNWRSITHQDLRKIMDACPSEPWRLLFALCRLLGLRRGEALSLRWGDIRIAENQVTVNADIKQETNKKRVRIVPIEPSKCRSGAIKLLSDAFEAAPEGSCGPCDGVDVSNIDAKAPAIVAAAGVGRYSKPFHTLRKCCETDWAQVYPQYVVSEWIGHDITVSADHYLRVPVELYKAPRRPAAQIVPKGTAKQ